MSARTLPWWGRTAVAAAVPLAFATAVRAQDAPQAPAASPSPPAALEPSPSPVPTPLPLLLGPGHDTLRALAAALTDEMEHLLEGTQAVVAAGRPARVHLPGIRMFKRRAQWFRDSVDKYRTEPFEVVGAAGAMRARAGMLSRRARRNEALRHTWPDWDAALDILDRIEALLSGEKVTVPSPHPRSAPAPPPSPTPGPR